MKKFISLLISAFITLITSCNPSKMTFGNADKWIPSDFNPSKTTLLIEKFTVSKKAQQQIEDYMSENYPYKYEFAQQSEIENKSGKYSDLKKYKFAIIYSSHNTHWTKQEGASTTGGLTVTGFDYNFVDREIDKIYPPTKKSNSYAIMTFKPMINTIVKKFE